MRLSTFLLNSVWFQFVLFLTNYCLRFPQISLLSVIEAFINLFLNICKWFTWHSSIGRALVDRSQNSNDGKILLFSTWFTSINFNSCILMKSLFKTQKRFIPFLNHVFFFGKSIWSSQKGRQSTDCWSLSDVLFFVLVTNIPFTFFFFLTANTKRLHSLFLRLQEKKPRLRTSFLLQNAIDEKKQQKQIFLTLKAKSENVSELGCRMGTRKTRLLSLVLHVV